MKHGDFSMKNWGFTSKKDDLSIKAIGLRWFDSV